MRVLITAQEVMDMVIKAMTENGLRFDNVQHEVKTPTNTDVPEYEGISFNMKADFIVKKVI